MSNIDKQTLPLRMRNYLETALKSGVKLLHLSIDELEGLLDELDKYQQYAKERDAENESLALTVGRLRIEQEAVQQTSAARLGAIDTTHKMFQREQDRAEAAEKRIAELEASHSKLREGMAAIYNAICADGASTSLSAILTFVKQSFEESAAAGISIKGSE